MSVHGRLFGVCSMGLELDGPAFFSAFVKLEVVDNSNRKRYSQYTCQGQKREEISDSCQALKKTSVVKL